MGAVRGVKDVRTLSAVLHSGTHSNERHVHQFQLASLELERTRRHREREAAMRRIGAIEARLAEIGLLIEKHQRALAAGAGADGRAGEESAGGDAERARTLGSRSALTALPRRVLRY